MDTTNNAPADEAVVESGQVENFTPLETTTQTEGQGEGESVQSPDKQPVPFDERLNGFLTKKGWKPDNWQQQILDSYEQLESKLGDWSQVEEKASWVDQNFDYIQEAHEKARMWEEAQEKLRNLEQTNQIKTGQLNFNALPVDRLASLWKSGQIGLSDLPPQRQFEVQQYAIAEEQAIDTHARDTAQKLADANPFLKDPEVANLVADWIERGLEPEQAVQKAKSIFSSFEKKGEERVKKNIEMLKQGNLERTSSSAPTKVKPVIKSVRDAFLAAKAERDGTL